MNPCLNRFSWLLACFLLLAFAQEAAAQTPAGTLIRNQAKMTYELASDPGRVYEASSNEILIEVLPIYGIEITPSSSTPLDILVPGNEAQFQYALSKPDRQRITLQYRLTFTGNVPDTATIRPTFLDGQSDLGFRPQLEDGDTGFLVYRDVDNTGSVSANDVLVASWRDANLDGVLQETEISVTTLGLNYEPGETENFLITFFVPNGLSPGERIFLGIEGISVGDPSQTAEHNYSFVQVVDGPVMDLRKTADESSIAAGNTLTYTVDAENIGSGNAEGVSLEVDGNPGSHTGVLVFDRIPVDETTNEPFILDDDPTQLSGVSGTFIYTTRDLDSASSANPESTSFDPTGNEWNWSTIRDVNEAYTLVAFVTSTGAADIDLAPDEGVSFRLELDVPMGTRQQAILNRAYSHFLDNGSPRTIRSVNETRTVVEGSFGISLTPAEQTEPAAQPGRSVYFTSRVINTGTGVDTFNLTFATDDGDWDLPSGWSAVFLKSDGLTPLTDTGQDGIGDTGQLQPVIDVGNPQEGSFFDVIVRVDIPEGATLPDPNAAPVASIVFKASSVADPVDTNAMAINRIGILGILEMDLENNFTLAPDQPGGATPGDAANKDPVTLIGRAGGFVDFPLIVRNTGVVDGETDSYRLTAPLLPEGWRVDFYRDLNEDGILDPAESARTDGSTGPVKPGEDAYMIARVQIPANMPADADYAGDPDQNAAFALTFRAESSQLPGLIAEQDNFVELEYFDSFQLEADRSGVIQAGSVTEYSHTVRNFSDRANRFYIQVNGGKDDWSYRLIDTAGDLLPVEAAPDGIERPYVDLVRLDRRTNNVAGTEAPFKLRIFASIDSPVGTTDVTSLQVLAWEPLDGTTQWAVKDAHYVVDVTTVVSGDLRLFKQSSRPYDDHIEPQEEIRYTTEFSNHSSGPLSDIVIYDQISPFTDYLMGSGEVTINGSPAGPGDAVFEISMDGGISYQSDDTVLGSSNEDVTNVRIRLQNDLDPGDTGSYEFSVIVK
ncbi:MAG: hypothetical protein JJU20_04970 [Opitutales bacterium]|nr:hypothetical protein [Opitutales bacterium]